jgi:hypothetical protein
MAADQDLFQVAFTGDAHDHQAGIAIPRSGV